MGECSFWYRPTRVVPDQRPLNGRCCCYHAIFGTAHIVCRAWSIKRQNVRPSVCSSRQQQTRCCRHAAVGLACRRYRSIAAAAACSGRMCRQCHVVSVRRKLNTDLFLQHRTTSQRSIRKLNDALFKEVSTARSQLQSSVAVDAISGPS